MYPRTLHDLTITENLAIGGIDHTGVPQGERVRLEIEADTGQPRILGSGPVGQARF